MLAKTSTFISTPAYHIALPMTYLTFDVTPSGTLRQAQGDDRELVSFSTNVYSDAGFSTISLFQ